MIFALVAGVTTLFYGYKAALPFRTALEEIGHPQPKILVVTDNKTAEGLSNKATRAYDASLISAVVNV